MSYSTPFFNLGCDPEFFFLNAKGKAEGCEKYIDIKTGVRSKENPNTGVVIVDGVQAEINTIATTCRQSLSYYIQEQFKAIKDVMNANPGISVSIAPLVRIPQKTLMTLSEKARSFGCMPSLNVDRKMQVRVKSKNPNTYLYRSAGGHIHLGIRDLMSVPQYKKNLEDIPALVRMLDVVVGNTCVMLDRHPGNVERRKVYGMAGEYRLPPHGLEYRTLSPFWLRSYQTMSMVFAFARTAVGIMTSEYAAGETNLRDEIFAAVDMKNVVKAINKNDAVLAKQNFDAIKHLLNKTSVLESISYGNAEDRIEAFEHFVEMGLDHWFDKDVVNNWVADSRINGWENFMYYTVVQSLNKKKQDAVVMAAQVTNFYSEVRAA